MLELGAAFWLQIGAYAVSVGVIYGSIKTEIKQLSARVEKHNGIIERVYKLEGKMENVEEDLKEVKHHEN